MTSKINSMRLFGTICLAGGFLLTKSKIPLDSNQRQKLIQTTIYTTMLKYVQTTFAVPADKMLYRILFFDRCNFRSLAFSVTDSTSVLRLTTWATLSRKASDGNSRVVGSELNEENKKSKAKP